MEISAPAPASGTAVYDWLHHWYPVGVDDDLLKDRPHSVQLFGKRLALWHDGRTWCCVEDRCPHRLAPLSEGRIETDGTLQCSYHGFRFNGCGACTFIPQAPADSSATTRALGQCRVAQYPVAITSGLVWVWAAGGVAPTDPPVVSETLRDGLDIGGGWLMRDMPYDFCTMIENILDPAHALFAHHGLLGDRNAAIPFPMKPVGKLPVSPSDSFTMELGSSSSKVQVSERRLAFRPPVYVEQKIQMQGVQSALFTAGYSVPIRPGWTRVFSTSRMANSPAATNISLAMKLVPGWLLHLYTNEVLDGDLTLLHGQERNLEAAGGKASAFVLPIMADRGVVQFRQWLERMAGGYESIPWADGAGAKLPPLETRRDVLLDRMRQHTCHCASCRQAYGSLLAAKHMGGALPLVCGLAALGLLALPGHASDAAGSAAAFQALFALAALGGGVGAVADAAIPLFTYKDYVHAEK